MLKFLSGDAATSWSKYRAVLVAVVAAVVIRGLRRERWPAGRHEILIRRDYTERAIFFFTTARAFESKDTRCCVGDLHNAVRGCSLFSLASSLNSFVAQ